MSPDARGEVPIHGAPDISKARGVVRSAAMRVGFRTTDVIRIVTATSELARNITLYAGSGVMRWNCMAPPEGPGIELVFADEGPGIADVEQAMQPGYTSHRGLGLGLPGAKRLMDEMELHSEPGAGTTIVLRKWLK